MAMDVLVRLSPGMARPPGLTTLRMQLVDDATVADLLRSLLTQHPELEAALDNAVVLVDGRHAGHDSPLRPGAEVALLRPIAGGSGPRMPRRDLRQ